MRKYHIPKHSRQNKLDFSTTKVAPKKLEFKAVCPDTTTSSQVKPSTRHMESFALDEIHDFVSYLQTVDGGNKTSATAKIIAKDISKYLYYADKKPC